MKPVRTHQFNGRKYKIYVHEPLDGWCDQYKCNERAIHLMTPLNTRNGLITVIHESLHASDWRQSEKAVDRVSKEVGRLLWRMGYRWQVKERDDE